MSVLRIQRAMEFATFAIQIRANKTAQPPYEKLGNLGFIRLFQISSAIESAEKRDFVRVFEIRADGNAVGESGHAHAERRDELGKVHCRRFTLDIGVRGNDDLLDLTASDTIDQFLDSQIGGRNSVHRRDRAAKHVVSAVVFLDLFQRHNGLGVLDNANDLAVSLFVRADRAKRLIAEIAADLASADVLFCIDDGAGEGLDVFLAHAEDGECVSDGGFSADSGKTAKFLDQLLQGKNVFRQRSDPRFLKTDRGSRLPCRAYLR